LSEESEWGVDRNEYIEKEKEREEKRKERRETRGE
jgi:hypothetical protein